jgi:hypothetical protein
VFHVAGLPPGSRHSDISTAFALAGVCKPSCLVLGPCEAANSICGAHTDAGLLCSAGIGRIQSVMLDAAGTTAAVAVQDTEALDKVATALADWGPQVGAPYCWLQHADVLLH